MNSAEGATDATTHAAAKAQLFRPFAVDEDREGSAVVMRIVGSVDMASAPTLADRVKRVLRTRPPMLVFDLADVDFLATAGLSVLLEAHRVAPTCDVSVRIVAANAVVGRPMELLGVDQSLHMYESLAGALTDGDPAAA